MHSTSRLKYLEDFGHVAQKKVEAAASPLCILVRSADHLGEINDNRLSRFLYEDIEFIKIAVD
jgi:hypothetical protein